MFVKVVVKSFLLSRAENIFTYSVPRELFEKVGVGKRVVIPFGKGNKFTIGLIVEICDFSNIENVKSIFDVIDSEEIISVEQIEVAKFLSERYISNLSYCLGCVLPPGDWSKIDEKFVLNDNSKYVEVLSDAEIQFFSRNRTHKEINDFGIGYLKFKKLIDEGIVIKHYSVKRIGKSLTTTLYKLKENIDYSILRKNAKKQIELVEFLNGKDYISIEEIKNNGFSIQTVNAVDSLGLLEKKEEVVKDKILTNLFEYKKLKLNEEQEIALNTVLKTEKSKFLIHGVTGSGKTEIYLQIVEEILKNNRSSIILVPEISLTPQTIERFSGRFGSEIAIIHSRLTALEKLQQWNKIKNGEVKIVVGARSAVFAPVKNLGAIIIDEEHEGSYISDQTPRYNTYEVASFICEKAKAKLILGSATPSVRVFNEAKNGKIELITIKNRATSNNLPEINVVDMREELVNGNKSILSEKLYNEIYETLKRKEQVVLFLNKRGRSSFVFCRSCGYVLKCDYCDISMTYHKNNGKDICVCHLCGRVKNKPAICPSCYKKSIKEFGFGTEMLEEYIKKSFPNARVHRIDGDTSKEKNAYEDLYKKMKNQEIDILIGTQMISKGLDFPNVTLVGVVLADITLNIPTYSSAEKTFQLITQVAGRSGRGEKTGKVVIQTYKPNHYSIFNSSTHNFYDFFENELKFRNTFSYPPVVDVVNFQFRSKNINNCFEELKKIKDEIFTKFSTEIGKNIEVLGPNPDEIKWVNMVYRYNLTVKVREDFDEFRKFLNEIIKDREKSYNNEKNGNLILSIN